MAPSAREALLPSCSPDEDQDTERVIQHGDGAAASGRPQAVGDYRTVFGVVAMASIAALLVLAGSLATSHTKGVMPQSTVGGGAARQEKSAAQLGGVARARYACSDFLQVDVPRHAFSLILTADPGDFSGVSEAHHVLANLVERRENPRSSSVCGQVSTGTLMGEFVVVATTGIGASAASMCTLEILRECGSLIKDIVYFGTSGWSPQRGGLLNPPACAVANWNNDKTRVGDVCVSPLSVNWVCKKASWQQQATGHPNQCVRPEEQNGPADNYLFGECMFFKDNLVANLALADELVSVARSRAGSANFPRRPVNVSALNAEYWGVVAAGVGHPAPKFDEDAPPRVFDYSECMEVDGNFFYNGSPWELKSREYAAATLEAAMLELDRQAADADGHSNGVRVAQAAEAATRLRGGREHTSATDMVAVSAMEAVGVSEALMRYHSLRTTRDPIPFTNVRTNSNWMVAPIERGAGVGEWRVGRAVPEDFVNGYSHAIATGSAAILSLHQDRCLARGARSTADGNRAGAPDCSFEIRAEEHEAMVRAGVAARRAAAASVAVAAAAATAATAAVAAAAPSAATAAVAAGLQHAA
ncbi:hypothetical protein FOA52_015329 [Chlamydomonas sp. UWO 241]|nr:hypothetical protein FOA52_015329 [Chlamydomonas sp. UWO 241]